MLPRVHESLRWQTDAVSDKTIGARGGEEREGKGGGGGEMKGGRGEKEGERRWGGG